MRRRSLLGEENIEYVFSASSTSSSVTSTSGSISIPIISTANGNSIGYTYTTSSSSLFSSVTTGATTVRIYYKANITTSSRSGYVYLTQNGSGKRINIYVSQSGGTYTFSASSTSYSVCPEASGITVSIDSSISGVKTGFTVSSSGGSVTSVTTASTSVTISYSQNASTTSSQSSTVTLKQSGSNNTITISITQSRNIPDSEWYLPVLFFNTSTGARTEIPYSTWSGYTSSSTYKPIAIKVSGLTNTYVSIDYMSWKTPDTGSKTYGNVSNGTMTCAGSLSSVSNLSTNSTSYLVKYQTKCGGIAGTTNPSSVTDTDGKSNNQKILAVDNSNSTAWQTASTINATGGTTAHPPEQCAWRYHTSGTNQGDWYIPSRGEGAYFLPMRYSWRNTILKLNTIWSGVGPTNPSTGMGMWTSSKGPSSYPAQSYYINSGNGRIINASTSATNGMLAFIKI